MDNSDEIKKYFMERVLLKMPENCHVKKEKRISR